MTNRELNKMAEDVRKEGYEPSSSRTDLVFDPATGEFRTVSRGTTPSVGDTVTQFTEGGFAVDEGEKTIYLNEQDVLEFGASGASEAVGTGRFWPKENVYHLGLGEPDGVKKGRELTVRFISRCEDVSSLASDPSQNDEFAVICGEGRPQVFRIKGTSVDGPLEYEFIPARENLYSRAKGLLEVGVLENKRVAIVGLGSFGSQIAIELAKAGVGHFSLMDFDRVELHNLMRHTASVEDLGRMKTDVIEEAVLGKNPYASVEKFPVNINDNLELLYSEVEKADLVIVATDNNTSRFNISKALVEKRKVGIFGRAITRAEGGDVFRYRPGGPCYCCIVGSGHLQEEEITDVASARRNGRIAAYVSPEDAEAMVQVGLSSDIEPICNMMVKLALVELSRGTESGISSLEAELVYDCYIWANRRDRHYSNWKSFPSAGPLPSILRWYGVKVNKNDHCPICSNDIVLDDNTDDIERLSINLD